MKIQKRWKNGQKRIFLEISSMRTVDVLWAACHSTPRRRAGGVSRPSSHKTRVWEPQRPWSEFPQLVDTAQWHVVPTHIDETDELASCWKAGGKVAVLGTSADQTAWAFIGGPSCRAASRVKSDSGRRAGGCIACITGCRWEVEAQESLKKLQAHA